MQPRQNAFHLLPAGVSKTVLERYFSKYYLAPPPHRTPRIQTLPSTRILHNSRRHCLINDVFGYALASYDHETPRPTDWPSHVRTISCRMGQCAAEWSERKGSGVSLHVGLRQGCRRGVFGLCRRLITHVLQQHLVGLLDLEEGEGE